MVGTGTSFIEGFMVFAEAGISVSGYWEWWVMQYQLLWLTPTHLCLAKQNQAGGFHRGAMGAPHLGSVVGLQQMRVV